jgi:hypothetical protein
MITKQDWGGNPTPDDIRYCCGWNCECDWYQSIENPWGQGVEWHADYNFITVAVPGDVAHT